MKHKISDYQKSHAFQRCCKKILYETYDKAESALLKYSFTVIFSSMNTYTCLLHDGFHLGHNYRMSNSDILSHDRIVGEKFGKIYQLEVLNA